MFLFEQVANVLQLVAVHRLEVLRRVAHGNDPVLDVGEVEVVPILVVPDGIIVMMMLIMKIMPSSLYLMTTMG